MLTVLREAAYFARHQFQPLFQIALLYTLPSLTVELALGGTPPAGMSASLLNGFFLCLGILQFGAAILYIDARVQGHGISPGQAIGRALQRLGGLLLVNLLMGLLVFGGLMLLVLPGLFLAYKLVFAELFLLLHRQNPVDALKSSYQATTGLAGSLLPPLLFWGSLVAAGSLLPLMSAQEGGADPLMLVVHHLLMLGLSIWGWALIYRLYQQHIVPPTTLPQEPTV